MVHFFSSWKLVWIFSRCPLAVGDHPFSLGIFVVLSCSTFLAHVGGNFRLIVPGNSYPIQSASNISHRTFLLKKFQIFFYLKQGNSALNLWVEHTTYHIWFATSIPTFSSSNLFIFFDSKINQHFQNCIHLSRWFCFHLF